MIQDELYVMHLIKLLIMILHLGFSMQAKHVVGLHSNRTILQDRALKYLHLNVSVILFRLTFLFT